MDAISYSYADKAHKRIKKFIENPDSTSGVLTVPKTIAAGETITIPAGRVAILPDLQVDGDLIVDGDLFIPTGSMTSQVVQKVASTDNAIPKFNGTTGDIQDSNILIDSSGNLNITGTGKRITGDFSNATASNRVAFQSNVMNGNTVITAKPNGTGTLSMFICESTSDAGNCQTINIQATTIDTKIVSAARGTGSYVPMLFITGGSERMTIDTAGNVGIGDSTPQYKLSISQSISLPSTAGSKLTSFSKYTNVGNASFLRFDTVRVSTGTTHNTSEERIRKVVDNTEMGYIGFGENNIVFGNNTRKLAAVGNSGFIVNTGAYTTNNYWSNSDRAAGTDWGHLYGTSSDNSIANIIIYGNGNIVNANNSYGALSDIKLKENIIDTSPKLDKLMKVRVVNYNLIGQEQKQIGVIAQEIEQIFPSLIDETKDTKQVEIEKERLIPALDEIVDNDGNVVQEAKPEYIEKYMDIETIETGETTKSVKYSVLYMMMLKGMQEQQEIINSLVKRVETLEGSK